MLTFAEFILYFPPPPILLGLTVLMPCLSSCLCFLPGYSHTFPNHLCTLFLTQEQPTQAMQHSCQTFLATHTPPHFFSWQKLLSVCWLADKPPGTCNFMLACLITLIVESWKEVARRCLLNDLQSSLHDSNRDCCH